MKDLNKKAFGGLITVPLCVVASDSWPRQTWIVRQALLVDRSTGREETGRQIGPVASLFCKNQQIMEATMPDCSGSFSGRATSQTIISLPDASNHDLNLVEVRGVQKSTDHNWDNAKITYWGTADVTAGNGPQRGYFVNEHADGDRDFGTFEGKIATTSGEVMIEGTWKYTGGTGNFQGLTGGGTYKGRMTSPTEVENTWEGAYELATKARAA